MCLPELGIVTALDLQAGHSFQLDIAEALFHVDAETSGDIPRMPLLRYSFVLGVFTKRMVNPRQPSHWTLMLSYKRVQ